MAGPNLQTVSTYNPLILSEEDESYPSFPLRYRTPDEEALIRQPPTPAELNSMNMEPDPDLQLTPLKQKEQPKSLLRSQTGHSKVRHRVHFLESGSPPFESEQDISNKISEVMITDSLSPADLPQENENNNSLTLGGDSFFGVVPPNPSDCLFFDADSGGFAPDLLPVGVIREIHQSRASSMPTSSTDFPAKADPLAEGSKKNLANSQTPSMDFPTQTDPQVERCKKNSSNSQPYCQEDYTNPIALPEVSEATDTLRDNYLPKEGSDTTQKKKMPILTKPNHFQINAVNTDLYPNSSRTYSLCNMNSADKEPSPFGEPKLHSTLHLAQKIKILQKKRPDLTSELKKNLENKEQRNRINEKAASKVDICSNQDLYSGLISLDVSNFEFEEVTIVQRSTKLKHSKKKATTSGVEPDLLEFFTEDLQKETADFSLPGISNPAIETCNAPSLMAFDLYRHNRLWVGLPGTV